MILMEQTEKLFSFDEAEGEMLIEKEKQSTECDLIDYKVSKKSTKDGEYFIVTLKKRFKTLQECKEG